MFVRPFVRSSVRFKFVQSSQSSSFWLKSSSNQSGISQQSESTQRALRKHSESYQKALRVFKSESYSRSLKYCVLLTQFFSPDGTSCTLNDLNNPKKDDFESGKVDHFTGSVLGPCEFFHPEKISSVKFTHTSGDSWKGEYLKISYAEKSFTCNLGQMLDNNTSITFPCSPSKGKNN